MNQLGLDQIYVINVRSFAERRRHIIAQLERFGLEGEFIHAWDVADLSPQTDARYFAAAGLSPGQKSCAMKHVETMRRIVDRGQTAALVLEDDAVLSADFEEGVRAALREANQYPAAHVIFIGSGGNFYTPRSLRRPGRRLYPSTRGRFADSYIIGMEAAKLRLARIDTTGISRPIDNQLQHIDLELNIQMLWLEDPVVEQGSKLGLFRTVLEPAPPRFVQRLKFAWEKLRRKYIYQLWR